MTNQSLLRWTCDSCGTAVETPRGEQPDRWVGFAATKAGLPAASRESLGHYCPDCSTRILEATQPRGPLQGVTVTGGSMTIGTIKIDATGMHWTICGGQPHFGISTCLGRPAEAAR